MYEKQRDSQMTEMNNITKRKSRCFSKDQETELSSKTMTVHTRLHSNHSSIVLMKVQTGLTAEAESTKGLTPVCRLAALLQYY